MTEERAQGSASVGVVERGSAAILVTVGDEGDLLDRREIRLTEPGLPTHPHHHEGSWAVGRYLGTPGAREITLAEAVALVERVRDASERGAHAALATLAAQVARPIRGIAIRTCPPLPPTIEARIADPRAQAIADSAMYRDALATAAAARGWTVSRYEKETVFAAAAEALGREEIEAFLRALGREIGPPWRAEHRLAAAAALAAMTG